MMWRREQLNAPVAVSVCNITLLVLIVNLIFNAVQNLHITPEVITKRWIDFSGVGVKPCKASRAIVETCLVAVFPSERTELSGFGIIEGIDMGLCN